MTRCHHHHPSAAPVTHSCTSLRPGRRTPTNHTPSTPSCCLALCDCDMQMSAAVRYRRWRNGVASGRLPDGTTSEGSGKEAGIRMSAGQLFKLEENEGFLDQQCQQEQECAAQ